jgi:hypothetical protein
MGDCVRCVLCTFWNADGHCECSGIWTGDSCEEYDDECDHIVDVVDPERSIAPHALNMRTATYRALYMRRTMGWHDASTGPASARIIARVALVTIPLTV